MVRSIRFRAALGAAAAAAVIFGLGWLWFRHEIYAGRTAVAADRARADAQTIAVTSFPGDSGQPVNAAPASYLATWVAVFADGQVVTGGWNGVDAFLANGQLSLPYQPDTETVTVRLGQLQGAQGSPLEGQTVTFVSAPTDLDLAALKGGLPQARVVGVDPPPGKAQLAPKTDTVTQPPRATVYVLVSPIDATEAVASADSFLRVGVPLAVLFVAGIAWIVTGRALRPVERIRARLAEVSASQLHERVPVPRTGDELAHLARTMNATLDRLEEAVAKQQRFVADAAHELRSPLASLRNTFEVTIAYPDDADITGLAILGLRHTTRLQALTDDLLLLARLDPATAPCHQVVDLAALAEEQVAERLYLHPDGPKFVAQTTGEATVAGDEAQLARLLRNLLDNAARHARTTVTVTTQTDQQSQTILTVADDGPGIPIADRERVFQRFTRLDHARSRDTGGTGLGLAIARDIATRHRGTLTVADSPHGAKLILRLPARHST
ncbi:MAG TPA: ATP-binding protein [Candidatus Limnocylindrales bacterium]|nr:ATP-binding protein [Candidatus Limnocylindrales bacterium]